MSEVTQLGSFPKVVPLKLTTGGDWALTAVNKDKATGAITNYASGAALAIVFSNGTTWNATVSTSNAAWVVNKSVADLIPEGTAYRITYTDSSGADIVLYKGPVYRDDSQG